MAATCLKNLGASFEKLGNEEMAAELYRGALEMNPQLPEAHLALGQYLHRQGQFEEALTHYDATLFDDRDLGKNASVTGWRLNALFNLGQDREAFRAINLLLADADREPWIWSWCARQVAAFGRTSVAAARGALTFWQRYVRTHPGVSAARADLLLTSFYLRSEGEEIGKDYATFRAEFETHIAHVDPSEAALPWDRLGHWAQDIGTQLKELKLRTLVVHWGVAYDHTSSENNCLVVTARNQPFTDGIILDGWRRADLARHWFTCGR